MVGKSIKEVLDNLSTQLGLNYSQKGSYIVLSSYKAKRNICSGYCSAEENDYGCRYGRSG